MIAHGQRRKLYGGSDQEKIVPYEGNIACLDCYVRTCPDCNSNIGRGKGWSVVYAVAHHGCDPTLRLKPPDLAGLVPRQNFGRGPVQFRPGGRLSPPSAACRR